MRKILKITAIATVFFITVLALAFTASAGIGGIFLSPYELPENQVEDGSRASFDLYVTPGTTQEIHLNVRNGREYAVMVELGLNTAMTNMGGLITYGATNEQLELDDGVRFLLSDIASFPGGVSSIEIEIPGLTTAIVPITLNIPRDGFEGLLLGGIHSLLGLTQADLEEGGMIVNRFANVMPIRMRVQGGPPIEPDFTLGVVDADVVSAVGSFIARIHNPTPRISAGALASMWIIPVGADQAIFYHENMEVEFAPYSIFHFILRDREGYGIFPGDYRARVRVEYDGRVWEFDQEFTVTVAAARAVAEGAVGQAHMLDIIGRPGPPTLVIVLISLAVLLLLAVIYLMLKNMKSNKAAAQQLPPPPVPGTVSPEKAKGDNGALDKLKGMDEDKLAKMLEQIEQQDTGEDNNEK